jgi:hypothetical protein
MPFPSEPLTIPTVSPGKNVHTHIFTFIAKDRGTIKERRERGGGVCMSGVILVCLLVENVQACETLVKIL